MSLVYVDTSVLAKRYLPSEASDAVDDLFDRIDERFAVSELCLVEVESILARRAREPGGKMLDLPKLRMRFENDLRLCFFEMQTLSTAIVLKARQLIAEGHSPLATLDALHLSTALGIRADAMATDDRQLARAAASQGLNVITFV